uniref:Uncharacterized protein n=1 Tax=viral metagenome TaxID=1070528 RepID=A0A6C0HI26_9ZZZZ
MNFKKSSLEKSKFLLTNKYILIFVFIVSIGNIIQLGTEGDYTAIAIILLVGLITSCFSKNMTVIMIIAISVANILKFGTKISKPWIGNEGFETDEKKEDEPETEAETETESESEKEEEDEGEKKKTKKAGKSEEDQPEKFTTKKQDIIESDALDDLRAEMKLGFKRLNQNIDSIQSMGMFN